MDKKEDRKDSERYLPESRHKRKKYDELERVQSTRQEPT